MKKELFVIEAINLLDDDITADDLIFNDNSEMDYYETVGIIEEI